MLFVIDAFNLIHAHDPLYELLDRRGFQPPRDELVRMLARFALHEDLERLIAVFDGSPKAGGGMRRERASGCIGASKVELVFADPERGADRVIHELVEAAKRPGEITAVSDDKFVLRGVKSARGHTLGCRAFLKLMREAERRRRPTKHREDPRKYRGLSDSEVKEWMEYFGFREDE